MLQMKKILPIILIAFGLSVFLGYIDHETESLYHLFTADFGNILAILFYTAIFTFIGIIVRGVIGGITKVEIIEES